MNVLGIVAARVAPARACEHAPQLVDALRGGRRGPGRGEHPELERGAELRAQEVGEPVFDVHELEPRCERTEPRGPFSRQPRGKQADPESERGRDRALRLPRGSQPRGSATSAVARSPTAFSREPAWATSRAVSVPARCWSSSRARTLPATQAARIRVPRARARRRGRRARAAAPGPTRRSGERRPRPERRSATPRCRLHAALP